MRLADLAAERRTHKAFRPEPVPRETLLELLAVARLAPNHHLTQPWRFRVLGPETLARLQECAGPAEAAKLERAPTLVLASAALSGELVQDEEDVCATAAARPPAFRPGSACSASSISARPPASRRRASGHP